MCNGTHGTPFAMRERDGERYVVCRIRQIDNKATTPDLLTSIYEIYTLLSIVSSFLTFYKIFYLGLNNIFFRYDMLNTVRVKLKSTLSAGINLWLYGSCGQFTSPRY